MKNIKLVSAIFLSSILAVILIEGTTRLFFKITNRNIDIYRNFSFSREAKIYMLYPSLEYKLIPNVSRSAFTSEFSVVYTTNSMGLREKEIKDTDKFKILFLGDSCTFGEGLPIGSRFSDIIEKEISNVYAINAGVPGYGIHQMYSWLKDFGINLRPDLVICSIIGGDLNRAIYKKIEKSPHLLMNKQETRRDENKINYIFNYFHDTLDPLLKKSYFYSLFKVRIEAACMLFSLKERDKKVWEEIEKKGDFLQYKITTDEQKRMVRDVSAKILLDFKDICDRERVKFLLVYISPGALPWLK
ncbi:MAG: SGNH/GDSL hydrolase family protein, partial [bacterium]|nr:SGNH/GDSL hydrolase family protein [bacterium]